MYNRYNSKKVYRSIRTCCDPELLSITTDNFYNSNNSGRSLFLRITYEDEIYQVYETNYDINNENIVKIIKLFKNYMRLIEILDDDYIRDDIKKYYKKLLYLMFLSLKCAKRVDNVCDKVLDGYD